MLVSIARAESRAFVVMSGLLSHLIALGRRRGRAAAHDDLRYHLSIVAVLLLAPAPLYAADDTFTCLTAPGPKVTVWRDFGYTGYKNRKFADNTRFDVQRSLWKQEQVPEYKNQYAINIGGGKNACWAGGAVLGTSAPNASWGQLYAKNGRGGRNDSVSIIWINAPNMTVDGIRVHNAWDSIRPGPKSANFTVKNVWVSRSRDDCFENDNRNPGLITDSLIDGCYVFYSSTGGSSTVTIENTLARLQPMPGAHCESGCLQPGTKGWIKGGPVNLKLYNNIFLQEQKGNVAVRSGGIPTVKANGTPKDKILDCSNNIMVWTGPGEYPYHLDSRCFTVTKDKSVWDKAKQNWINCHPKVRRVAGDPEPKPSKCDPNAPGGGEGGTAMVAARR
jgi:hypothetical protein